MKRVYVNWRWKHRHNEAAYAAASAAYRLAIMQGSTEWKAEDAANEAGDLAAKEQAAQPPQPTQQQAKGNDA
jgi:hypothetical protein